MNSSELTRGLLSFCVDLWLHGSAAFGHRFLGQLPIAAATDRLLVLLQHTLFRSWDDRKAFRFLQVRHSYTHFYAHEFIIRLVSPTLENFDMPMFDNICNFKRGEGDVWPWYIEHLEPFFHCPWHMLQDLVKLTQLQDRTLQKVTSVLRDHYCPTQCAIVQWLRFNTHICM